ncbi:MAG: helix-turn-helix transcriptional regulator [Pseudodonghicola sp.]
MRELDFLNQDLAFNFTAASSAGYRSTSSFHEPRVEVSIIFDGGLDLIVDGKHRSVRAPCVSMQAYETDLVVATEGRGLTRTAWCHFRADRLSTSDWDILRGLPSAMPIPGMMPSLFNGALSLQEHDDTPDPAGDLTSIVRNSIGRSILAEYCRCAIARSSHAIVPRSVRAAKQAIDAASGEELNLAQLAEIAGVNRSYLVGLFKKYVGQTPIQYLWAKRVEQGLHLLKTTSLSIEDIAQHCGFKSSSHFSRSIKEATGSPPSKLRI